MTLSERRNAVLQRYFELGMDRFGLTITEVAREIGITYDSAHGFITNAKRKAKVMTDVELIVMLYGLPHGRSGRVE